MWENAHYGARVIKLVADDQPYVYSTEDLRFVVEEARRMNLKVAVHVWTKGGAHNAAAAGVASLEHLNGISDEDLALAKNTGRRSIVCGRGIGWESLSHSVPRPSTLCQATTAEP